jgi:hypothetical protein
MVRESIGTGEWWEDVRFERKQWSGEAGRYDLQSVRGS